MQFFENRQKKHNPGRDLPSATFPKLKSRSAKITIGEEAYKVFSPKSSPKI